MLIGPWRKVQARGEEYGIEGAPGKVSLTQFERVLKAELY